MRGVVWLVPVLVMIGCSFERGVLQTDGGGDTRTDTPGGDGIAFVGHSFYGVSNTSTLVIPANPTDGAYVLAMSTKPYEPVTSVSGLGAAWTLIADQCGARSATGVAVYVGRGATTSGSITVSFANPVLNAIGVAAVYLGSTGQGAIARYNTRDLSTCNEPDSMFDVTSYSVPIAASPGGRVVAAVGMRQRTHTPGAGLVQQAQRANGMRGETAGLALTEGAVTFVSGTFDAEVDAAVVAVELR